MATSKYEQAISGLNISKSSQVVRVRDGNDTWLCPALAWEAAQDAMEGEDAYPDDEGGADAYSDLCNRARKDGVIVSLSGSSKGTDEEQTALVWHAVEAELLDAEEPLALRYFPFPVETRVEGGETEEDHDTGKVVETRQDGSIRVAWSSGVSMWLSKVTQGEIWREGQRQAAPEAVEPLTVQVDWGCSAEAWFDALAQRHPELAKRLEPAADGPVEVSPAELAILRALPGWDDGTEGAPHPLIVRGELAEEDMEVVYVVSVAQCGGPATGIWHEDRLPARPVLKVDLIERANLCGGATHLHGAVPVRMATEKEREVRQSAAPNERPWTLYRGRPCPPAPSYQ